MSISSRFEGTGFAKVSSGLAHFSADLWLAFHPRTNREEVREEWQKEQAFWIKPKEFDHAYSSVKVSFANKCVDFGQNL